MVQKQMLRKKTAVKSIGFVEYLRLFDVVMLVSTQLK